MAATVPAAAELGEAAVKAWVVGDEEVVRDEEVGAVVDEAVA